jgi:Carboxypeptidase regulatory-like domain
MVMTPVWASVLAFGVVVASDAGVQTIELRSAVACTGIVRFEPICDGERCPEPVTIDFTAPGQLTPPPMAWRGSIDRGDCWAPPFQTDKSSPQSVTMVGLTQASGRLISQHPLPVSGSMSVQVPDSDEWLSSPGTCTLRESVWSCAGPVSTRHLRIEIPGFSTAYYWGADLSSGETKLENRVVAAGASIVGTVTGPRRFPLDTVELTAREVKTGKQYRARSDERGFFQLTGLQPGEYSVTAVAKHLSSPPAVITIREEREHLLPEPVDLREHGGVHVVVTPAPIGRASWTVHVQRPDAAGEILSTVAQGSLDESGSWHAEGLNLGSHVVAVLNEEGQVLHRENIEVTGEQVLVNIAMELVPVRGRVSLGSEPLQAAVQFYRAGSRLTFEADENGEFSGMFPEEGKWQVQVTPANELQHIRTEAIEIRRSATQAWARADITLPNGRIRGTIVNRLGKPVPDAQVLVMRGDAVAANAGNQPDGSFRVFGLDEGDVTLIANDEHRESAPLHYRVSKDPTETRLVLEESIEVRGRVITETGQPVPGAVVRYLVGVGVGVDGVRESVTGPSGEFRMRAPTGAPANLAVLAPGFPVTLLRFVAGDVTPVIRLSSVPALVVIRLRGAPPWPYLVVNGAAMPLYALFRTRIPGQPPAEATQEGFLLEVDPGQYAVCSSAATERCIAKVLPPAARITIDASILWPPKP